MQWFASYSDLIGRTMAVFIAPALVGVAGSVALNRSSPDRQLWLVAASSMGLILVLTAVWFLPINADFASGAIAVGDVADTLETWFLLHWLRVLLGLEVCVVSTTAVLCAHRRAYDA